MVKIVYSTEDLFDGKIYKMQTCKITTKKEKELAKMFGTDCGRGRFVFQDGRLKDFMLARNEMMQAKIKDNRVLEVVKSPKLT